MKIIVPGKLPDDKIYKGICVSCKCQFEFSRKEAHLTSNQKDGDTLHVACPTPGCARNVFVTP